MRRLKPPPVFDDIAPHEDLDFHAREECAEIMRSLGIIVIEWNFVEVLFGHLIWHYVGGIEVGSLITPELGNQTKADVLVLLARKHEKSRRLRECIEFAAKAFNRLREIRNILVHSHGVIAAPRGPKLIWTRMSSRRPGPVSVPIEHRHFVEIYDAVAYLGMFVAALHAFHLARARGVRTALPEIFALPDIPTQPRPVGRKGARRRRKSSPASQRPASRHPPPSDKAQEP